MQQLENGHRIVKKGAPVSEQEELFEAICLDLEKGISLMEICRRPGMPVPRTVLNWRDATLERISRYAQARDIGFDAIAEECLRIADDGSNDTYRDEAGKVINCQDVIQRSRLRVDTRRWLLSKWSPKKYGDVGVIATGGVQLNLAVFGGTVE